MPVDAVSNTNTAPVCLTPADDDPPKVDDKKKDEKKTLDPNAAASTPAPATTSKNVVVFAARFQREAKGREIAGAIGEFALKKACAKAVEQTAEGPLVAAGLDPLDAWAVAAVIGEVAGESCGPAGELIAKKGYDLVTGGPNTITFKKETVTVDVPNDASKADAKTADASPPKASTPKPETKTTAPTTQPSATKEASPAPNASMLPMSVETKRPSGTQQN